MIHRRFAGVGRRTLAAAGWQTWISVVRLLVGFVRFVMLARLLPVETFGQFGMATAAVGLSIVLPRFGLTAAFLHRAPETRDEEPAASVLFTLRVGTTLVWAAVLAATAFVLNDGGVRTTLLVLIACQLIAEPAFVPRLLLMRRLKLARIAFQESLSTIVGSAVAVVLAYAGAGIWALLAPSIVFSTLECVVFLGFKPVWRPRIAVDPEIARYLLSFGSRNVLIGVFDVVIEKAPELWTGLVFGTSSLGIYNRASRLASFPRRIATDPLVSVLPARFSELKERPREFDAVLGTSLAMIGIVGGVMAGGIWLLAPWLIEELIGAKWLPALSPFRILVALVVLEPLRLTLSCALVASGAPGRAARARGVQAVILVPAMMVGAASAELDGIATAVMVSAVVCVLLLAYDLRHRERDDDLGSR